MKAKKEDHLIVGVHVTDRVKHAPDVQKVLTEYGEYIKTRLGLHRVDEQFCSPRGLIILEMYGDESKSQELADQLTRIEQMQADLRAQQAPDEESSTSIHV